MEFFLYFCAFSDSSLIELLAMIITMCLSELECCSSGCSVILVCS